MGVLVVLCVDVSVANQYLQRMHSSEFSQLLSISFEVHLNIPVLVNCKYPRTWVKLIQSLSQVYQAIPCTEINRILISDLLQLAVWALQPRF